MTARLAEPALRLTALHGWVTPHAHHANRAPWPIHWAALTLATDDLQGVAACGHQLHRELQWWRASTHALTAALHDQGLWQLCGPCTYWAGGPPAVTA